MEKYTVGGHVVGMLDRDQRTVKLPCFPRLPCADLSHHNNTDVLATEFCHGCHSTHHKRRRTSRRDRKNTYLWKTSQRLKQVLIIGIYFLSLVSIPRTLSAPTRSSQMAERMKSHGKWINPCGVGFDNGSAHDINTEIPKVSDLELLTQIVNQANNARRQAESFKDRFVTTAFNANFEEHHKRWKNQHYSWLPSVDQIPKGLGEHVSETHLASLDLDTILLDAYEYLQKFAVGLEQVVWDQDDDAENAKNFNETEHHLRLVLCEMQMSIIEKGVKMRQDVSRDIMTDEYRNMKADNSSRKLRDWLIYRDYMNALEYVIEVFEYLKNRLAKNNS